MQSAPSSHIVPAMSKALSMVISLAWMFSITTFAVTNLEIQMVPMLKLTGEIGSTNQIQYVTDLRQTNKWITLTNIVLSTIPSYFVDTSSVGTVTRYYQAVLLTSTATTGPVPLPNFVKIPAGTFVMGSPTTEKERFAGGDDETQHMVTLTKDFYMSKYPVTQGEYLALMGNNPSWFMTKDNNGKPIGPDLNRPVEQVSWNDATNYCGKLTASEKTVGRLPTGWEYRLPTEAEWEYSCRAGTSTPFHYGNDLRSGMANFNGPFEYVGGIGTVFNPNGTYLARTTAVGSYAPNAFGLYDMHGNIGQWCLDWYGDYPVGTVTDPSGPASGPCRILRGGGWNGDAKRNRSAFRFYFSGPANGYIFTGFRPVLARSQ